MVDRSPLPDKLPSQPKKYLDDYVESARTVPAAGHVDPPWTAEVPEPPLIDRLIRRRYRVEVLRRGHTLYADSQILYGRVTGTRKTDAQAVIRSEKSRVKKALVGKNGFLEKLVETRIGWHDYLVWVTNTWNRGCRLVLEGDNTGNAVKQRAKQALKELDNVVDRALQEAEENLREERIVAAGKETAGLTKASRAVEHIRKFKKYSNSENLLEYTDKTIVEDPAPYYVDLGDRQQRYFWRDLVEQDKNIMISWLQPFEDVTCFHALVKDTTMWEILVKRFTFVAMTTADCVVLRERWNKSVRGRDFTLEEDREAVKNMLKDVNGKAGISGLGGIELVLVPPHSQAAEYHPPQSQIRGTI